MSDNKNSSVEKRNNSETNKRRSFFGGSLDNHAKDFLDFRYNTQEEIDKLNEEMTNTDDLDEIIKQTNDNKDQALEGEIIKNTDKDEDTVDNNEIQQEDIHEEDDNIQQEDIPEEDDIAQQEDNLEEDDNIQQEDIPEEDDIAQQEDNLEEDDNIQQEDDSDDTIENYKIEEINDTKEDKNYNEGGVAKFFDPFEINIEDDNLEENDDVQQDDIPEDDDVQQDDIPEDIIKNSPMIVNSKKYQEETNEGKRTKKNFATGEPITNEEIQLEQGHDLPNIENNEEYQPTSEELFEREPEFFADDELSQQFMHLVQNVRGIFKLKHKELEQNPYFKILGGKNENSTLEYLFYLIEEDEEPIDLYIKKVETDQENNEENEHLVQFSYGESKELDIFVDEIILYEKINKSNSDEVEYIDTKAILEKFIFLTENHYNNLKSELDKIREEKNKKRQLQQIFKGF